MDVTVCGQSVDTMIEHCMLDEIENNLMDYPSILVLLG